VEALNQTLQKCPNNIKIPQKQPSQRQEDEAIQNNDLNRHQTKQKRARRVNL